MIAPINVIAQRAASSIQTLESTYAVCSAAVTGRVKGDFVECGVFAGANAAIMASAVGSWTSGRKVHLFDSFTGIPLCGKHDTEFIEAQHPAGLSCATQEEVRQYMREWHVPNDLLVYHPGMFQDTVPKWAATKPKIAVLRLDGDLYESTKVCIEHLYPLVSPGGWIIVDDWDLSGARKAVLDFIGQGFGPIYFQRQ